MKSKSKKHNRRIKQPLLNVAYSMGKWKASDDYLLIQSILQLSCLKAVHQCTKFSKSFTIRELQERWNAIQYDAPISKMIYKKLQTLTSDEIGKLRSKAPFSEVETRILIKIPSTKTPTSAELNELLVENRLVFHQSRDENALKQHWLFLKQLHLLVDQQQKSGEAAAVETNISFDDKEKQLNDKEILENVNINVEVEEEMAVNYKKVLNQIKKTETELFLWQILVDHITKESNPFSDIECLAVLKSDNFEYIMKKREIKFGRTSDKTDVDLDFTTISPATCKKISRDHGFIKFNENGEFFIYNNSKHPIVVDGKILLEMCKTQLHDKSVVQINDISFLFFINFNTTITITNDTKKLLAKTD